MGIPIVGVVDSNSNPEGIDYVIPGNDDSIRSIALFTEAVADACIVGSKSATGLKQETPQSGPSIVRKAEVEIKEEVKEEVKEETVIDDIETNEVSSENNPEVENPELEESPDNVKSEDEKKEESDDTKAGD